MGQEGAENSCGERLWQEVGLEISWLREFNSVDNISEEAGGVMGCAGVRKDGGLQCVAGRARCRSPAFPPELPLQ